MGGASENAAFQRAVELCELLYPTHKRDVGYESPQSIVEALQDFRDVMFLNKVKIISRIQWKKAQSASSLAHSRVQNSNVTTKLKLAHKNLTTQIGDLETAQSLADA